MLENDFSNNDHSLLIITSLRVRSILFLVLWHHRSSSIWRCCVLWCRLQLFTFTRFLLWGILNKEQNITTLTYYKSTPNRNPKQCFLVWLQWEIRNLLTYQAMHRCSSSTCPVVRKIGPPRWPYWLVVTSDLQLTQMFKLSRSGPRTWSESEHPEPKSEE